MNSSLKTLTSVLRVQLEAPSSDNFVQFGYNISQGIRRTLRNVGLEADRSGASSTILGGLLVPSHRYKTHNQKLSRYLQDTKRYLQSVRAAIVQHLRSVTSNIKQANINLSASGVGGSGAGAGGGGSALTRPKYELLTDFGLPSSTGGGVQQGQGGGSGQGGGGGGGGDESGAVRTPRNRRFGSWVRKYGWRGLKLAGKAGAYTLGLGSGSIISFITSALQEAFAAYEQQARSQLRARAVLGGGARFYGGLPYGYSRAEGAMIQAQAGRLGLVQGTYAGANAAYALSRALGGEGLVFGGGLMMRQNLRGAAGVHSMMRQLSKAFALAVETGLERARVPEFLAAANQLAEEQIRISPTKDAYQSYIQELARFQMYGMRGRYAHAAIARAGQVIRSATGPAQAFIMRAFGFGRGASLMDVLKRQEMGAAAGNIMAVMQQLLKEYGVGPGGGLSAAGKLAFKGLGFGGIHMAEKFSKIYLEQREGKLTAQQALQKIAEIQEKEKLKKYPRLQVEAWRALKGVGGIIKIFAARTDRMAAMGAENLSIIKDINRMQRDMVKMVKPLLSAVRKLLPDVLNIIRTVLPTIVRLMTMMLRGITYIVTFIKGFAKGFGRGSGFLGRFRGGFRQAGIELEKLRQKYAYEDRQMQYEKIRQQKLRQWQMIRQIPSLEQKQEALRRFNAVYRDLYHVDPKAQRELTLYINQTINMPRKPGSYSAVRATQVHRLNSAAQSRNNAHHVTMITDALD